MCRKKGYKHSEETKKKMSLNHRKYQSLQTRKKISNSKKGKKRSEKTKKKISNSLMGHTHGFKKGIYYGFGFKKGDKPWNYIDGRSKNCSPARYGDDWFKIRLVIYKRDNFTCQKCGEKMSKFPFHIHHIVPFLQSFNNSLDNLITLCPSCHRKIEAKLVKQQIKMEV